MVAVSARLPTAGITRADAGSICATPDKIAKALASGCQLFFPGPTLKVLLNLIVSLLGVSLFPPCGAHWYFLDFSVFENNKPDNHLTPQHTRKFPCFVSFCTNVYQGKWEKISVLFLQCLILTSSD